MLREAIDEYHDLLDDELAGESQHRLDDQLRRRGLFFGDRALCTVLRPRFLSAAQYRFLQRRAGLVLRAFHTAYSAAVADERLLAQFKLAEWECTLVRHDPGFRDPSPVSRLDAFFVGESGGLRFTEYNAETPAGGAYNDVLTEAFYGLPIVREFLKHWDLRPLPARHNVLHALLDAYQQWSGTSALPRIAIVDWAEVPTRNEFVLFQDYFERQGIECVIADPREMEFVNGRLMAGGGPVDLIYKRGLITELVEREGLDHAVIRAVRDNAACMVNPFRCKILHKKASLAVLSDERNADLFTPEERETIDLHIPWTRRVEERTTVHHALPVDLVPYIVQYREKLVLKANDEYGGKGISLGWETSQEDWDSTIKQALEEPFIVQERVDQVGEPYPSMIDGELKIFERLMDTNPYVF